MINRTHFLSGSEVITKDADLVNSYLLTGQPYKLLVISTGNITNAELEAVFVPNSALIVTTLQANSYIELTRTTLIIHT